MAKRTKCPRRNPGEPELTGQDVSAIVAPTVSVKPGDGPGRLTLVVLKSKRKLVVYSRGQVLATYRVGLGSNPHDDKQVEGDGCTPEGKFYICTKNPGSKFTRSLGISYPNKEDAQRGLDAGLISKPEYGKIVRAIDEGKAPPWNTPLGGEICIHGGGPDWTVGCIALDNNHIRELYELACIGTPVIIRP